MATIVKCPKCGTLTPVSWKPLHLIGVVMFFPLGLLLLCLPKTGTCWKCGSEVRSEGMKLA